MAGGMQGLSVEGDEGSTSPAGERGQAKQLETAYTARDAARQSSLLRAAQRGDRTRDELVTLNLGLVRSTAARYRDLGLPYDDLVQEGAIGLLDAIDQFESGRGASFESYSRFRIRRAIRNALTDKARLIRLPKQVVERRRAIERAEARLTAAAAGRTPSPAEIASVTGLSVASVKDALGERRDSFPRRGPFSQTALHSRVWSRTRERPTRSSSCSSKSRRSGWPTHSRI